MDQCIAAKFFVGFLSDDLRSKAIGLRCLGEIFNEEQFIRFVPEIDAEIAAKVLPDFLNEAVKESRNSTAAAREIDIPQDDWSDFLW